MHLAIPPPPPGTQLHWMVSIDSLNSTGTKGCCRFMSKLTQSKPSLAQNTVSLTLERPERKKWQLITSLQDCSCSPSALPMLQRLDRFLYQFSVGRSTGYNNCPLCSHSSEESSGPKNTQQCHFTFGKGDAHTNQPFDVQSRQFAVSHCHHRPTGASQQHLHLAVPCHTL